jgi:hypothetical protein
MSRLKKHHLPPFFQRHQWMVNPLGALFFLIAPISYPFIIVVGLWDDLKAAVKDVTNEAWDMMTYRWED